MEAEVGMKLDAMRAAQDRDVSDAFLFKAQQARSNQRASIESGSMGMSMFLAEQGNSMIEFWDYGMGAAGFYGSKGPNITGPVSTTGNSGGP
jgi:hypothetical protein